MDEPLWSLPLAGYCDVCTRLATHLEVYPDHRLICHPKGRPCSILNPEPSDQPLGFYRRVEQPRKRTI
jgi:hypothetical protein